MQLSLWTGLKQRLSWLCVPHMNAWGLSGIPHTWYALLWTKMFQYPVTNIELMDIKFFEMLTFDVFVGLEVKLLQCFGHGKQMDRRKGTKKGI